MDGNRYQAVPAGERSDAIAQLHAAECAIRRTLLQVIAAHDHAESWRDDGATSMTSWLVAQLGMTHATAAQLVTVAERLDDLPAIAESLEEGRLSWDKTRALTRVATPETDAGLAEEAQGLTASQVLTVARRARVAEETEQDRSQRSLRMWWDRDGRWLRLHGRVAGAEGAAVQKAIERIANQAPPDADSGLFEPWEARAADALVELASARLAADPDPERATVVVHVDGDTLATGRGLADIEAGPPILGTTAQRLSCDGRWQVIVDGPHGQPIGIGRTSRRIPAWLTRQILRRDQGCRFPGCERTRWVHAHHLVHWAQGGPTDLDNLATLCGYHHRLVHEGGWRIEGSPNGDLIFIRPDGRPYQPRPEPLRPEVRARIVDGLTVEFADSSLATRA